MIRPGSGAQRAPRFAFAALVVSAPFVAAPFAAALLSPAATAQGIQRDAAIISEAVSSRVDAYLYKANTRSKLEFRGTTLAARAFGTARVSAESTRTLVDAQFEKLPQPAEFGPYTVYVLWAITPEGRASSLGVLDLSSSGKADLEVGTPLNGFAMIVTAEPHFQVSVPSTQVVLRNVAVEFTGRTQPVTTLTDRADYAALTRLAPASKRPIQVDQATYAVAIAEASGAERLASGPFATARAALAAADTAWRSKKSAERKRAPELGRVAVQAGEDARVAAMRRAEEIKKEEAQAQAAEAVKNAERAAAHAVQSLSMADALWADAQVLLARVHARVGKRGQAREAVVGLERALIAAGRSESPTMAWTLWLKGDLAVDDWKARMALRRTALDMVLKSDGPTSADAIEMQLMIRGVLTQQGRLSEAAQYGNTVLSLIHI